MKKIRLSKLAYLVTLSVAAIIITWSSSITVAANTSPFSFYDNIGQSFLSSYSETSGLDIAPGEQIRCFYK